MTDNLSLNRSSLFWDRGKHKFVRESRKRHMLPWLIVNYGLIGGIAIPGLCVFLYQSLVMSNVGSPLFSIIAIMQLCMGTATLVTCVAYRRWGSDLVLCLNKLITYELYLWRKYSSEATQIKLQIS